MGAGGAFEVSPHSRRMAQMTGRQDFKRNNPKSDKFKMHKFHHIEYWCPDATNAFKRFSWGLGMPLVAKSDHSTGNSSFASYVLKSNELTFIFTAPYSRQAAPADDAPAVPSYKQDDIYAFVNKHGLAVRAVGITVEDAKQAFEVAVQNGGKPKHTPSVVQGSDGQQSVIAEVHMYGDVVMRFISGSFEGAFLPTYERVHDDLQPSYGLHRLDHAVGNAPKMGPVLEYLAKMTGWHEFAEFTAEDVGTMDSGLNSKVLANDNEMVICPVNEPTFGTPRKSQIQTYLEQNEGAGLQHLAIKTHDIFTTMRQLQARSHQAGFDFMPRASDAYYRKLPAKFGGLLSEEQLKEIEELGLLADLDDQGILLQVFTKPVGDRPTLFLEIIQRIGCEYTVKQPDGGEMIEQAGGCGGFGKGNFTELFKSIEDYERTLKI